MHRIKSPHTKVKKGTMRRLLQYVLKVHKFKVILVLLFMVIATLSNVAATYLVQNVVKEVQSIIDIGSNDLTKIIKTILTMVLLYGVNIVLSYTYSRIMVDVSQDTLIRLRNDLFTHMTSLPIQYYDKNTHGDLMSRFTNDVDATRQMISQSLPQLFVSALTLIGYLTAMFITSYILAFITIFVTLSLLIVIRLLIKRSRKYFVKQQISVGKGTGYIEEMIEGQKVVKVYRHEKEAINNFNVLNDDLYQNTLKASINSGMLIPITVSIGYLGFSITAIVGAILFSVSMITIPKIVSFLLFTRNFTGPLNQMSQQANFIGLAMAGAGRIFDVLDEKSEVDNGKIILVNAKYENNQLSETSEKTNIWAWKNIETNELIRLNGDVRFTDVNFGYSDDKMVLKDVTLYAKPGQKIAFVGATGAGKTTITNLINRFYDIQSGTITYDGIDIKEISKKDLRRSLGIVLQDTNLFTKTVMENIRYGNLEATDEEVINSSKLANAHEFIMKLPNGYQTILTDNGSNLSQGQRQLLSIARVAVANPPVLILDEATSSIDTYTEKLIQNGMDKLMDGRTVFVIAHRLSTIKNAKAIIVLDYGRIIERGNHNDLIESKGRYYQLYTGVFELE
ncbi:ABC transporter ATP-binding protein [Haploplasma axanthum]|uniref:ABC-type multidrug/protein/lipid transport system ATPase component n=1 Tax=Haploplasma axanthum TaxID=29552 RepID=A0A449BF18_HAPAX|nr:ABC transporter ATP-binding protein [Haploplasma axanthum]VEU81022.1 ABC-type multidrug/protein/lipid transport system ATPase component [Haploplasma axanthum]